MKAIFVAIPLLLLTAGAHAREVKFDTEAGNQKCGADYAAGDAAAIVRLYTGHATVLPPGGAHLGRRSP